MCRFGTMSDDFFINMNLNTEMLLPQNRETVLHFFEQIKKKYPEMRNFYGRDRGEYVLEEDKENGKYRWATVENRRVCSGYVNPSAADRALEQHASVLDIIPYALTISPLDCESLNITFGFDYTYRGNHNELLVEALGLIPAFEQLAQLPGASVVAHEPSLQLAIDDECRTQCRLSFETRTSAYHVRTNEFPEEQLSVYLTARRYGSLNEGETYVECMQQLAELCGSLVDDYVADNVLRPLQEAIAIK